MTIKFGTSGWRAIISDEFTYDNVKIVTQAISEHVKSGDTQNSKPTIIVGYDTRFLSEKFAQTASQVLAGNGINVLLTRCDVPTPVIAYEIIRRRIDGGINFTASHNPPEYNGIKFSQAWGGPALPQTTVDIEKRCKYIINNNRPFREISFNEGIRKGLIQYIDPRVVYINRLKELVDLKSIKKAKLKVIVDVMYGTARNYLDSILLEAGCRIKVLHNFRDVLFGGTSPEPSLRNLKELLSIMKHQKYNIGLGTDGDGDRFGIVDTDGTFVSPNQVLALLLNYLISIRGLKGVVARSVMTSSFVDAVANKYGVEVKQTPVGFKYIGEILVNEDMIIGGEESGGITIKGHIPEKDGILACLLMTEMVSVQKKSIRKILQELYKEVGTFLSDRVNIRVPPERMEKLSSELRNNPPGKIAGLKVKKIITIDGFKFILDDNSWIGVRLSGTEPVVRIYVESSSKIKLEKLKRSAKRMVDS